MLKILPLLLALVVISFMILIPTKFGQVTSTPTTNLAVGVPPDGQVSDYNAADVLSATGNFDTTASGAIFNNQVVNYPQTQLSDAIQTEAKEETAVLGTTTNSAGDEKWIEIDLSKQQLTAWEGNKIVHQFLISSGLWDSTPRGTFYIYYKTRSQTMIGGDKADGTYYDLPNVPDNMFFNGGDAIHGAYWHHNFGHPMSHGCINEPLDQDAWMFDWAGPVVPPGVNAVKATADNPGTRVWIH